MGIIDASQEEKDPWLLHFLKTIKTGRGVAMSTPSMDQQHLSTLLGIYEEMVESAHDGILLVEDDTIIGCNPSACLLYGLDREQLIGMHPATLSPEYQPDGENSAIKADRYMTAAMAGTPQKFYWQHIRKGFGEFTAEVTLNPARSIELPGRGKRPRYVSTVRDVTAEQLQKMALRDSETRFRQLFEEAPVALALLRGNQIVALNKHWLELFGYGPDRIAELDDWWALAHPDEKYRKKVRAIWDSGLADMYSAGGKLVPFEYRVCCADGQYRHVLIGGAMVGRELMISFYDMTEQHRAQQALSELNDELEHRVQARTVELEQAVEHLRCTQQDLVRSEKLAGLGALVAGIAHELNTPIGNAVMVASSLQAAEHKLQLELKTGLKRSVFEGFLAELKESTDIIERNLRRSAELISSFKQVAVDQSSYQRRTFDMAEVLKELKLTMSPTLRNAGVELLETSVDRLSMESYPGPLTQVLMNVVNNAVMHAFGECSEPRIQINAGRTEDDEVVVQVEDNGCGIAPELLPRVFDPFYTTKLGQGGSGLGLHIAYTLVTDLLGGRIEIDSKLGQGTRVELRIPRKAPDSPAVEAGANN